MSFRKSTGEYYDKQVNTEGQRKENKTLDHSRLKYYVKTRTNGDTGYFLGFHDAAIQKSANGTARSFVIY